MNYNNKTFKLKTSTTNGSLSINTIFNYSQKDTIITCTYSSETIKHGQLLGQVAEDGSIDMRYHQLTHNGLFQIGKCCSTPEIMSNGKIRLHEHWNWMDGDQSSGNSILEEI